MTRLSTILPQSNSSCLQTLLRELTIRGKARLLTRRTPLLLHRVRGFVVRAVHLRAAPEDEEVAVRAEALVVVAVVGVVSRSVPISEKQGLRAALRSIPRRDIPRGLAAFPLGSDKAQQTAEEEGGDGELELHSFC